MILLQNNLKSFPRMNLDINKVSLVLGDYYNGIKTSKIQQYYNLKTGALDYIRKKLSLPIYVDNKYSSEKVGQAVEEYISGTLLKNVLKKYSISESTLTKYMKQNNIIYKNDHGRKNIFDKHFFDIIDCEAKAYFLGFIYADGCITKTDNTQTRENRLSINISAKDIEILEKFADAIIYDKTKIRIYTPNESTYGTDNMCRIDLNSVELVDSLKKHGVKSNKTLNISFPYLSMDKSLYKHFIRGFFDGDGCITSGPQFSIIGNKEILLPIQQILIKECNLNKTKLIDYPHKNIEIYDLVYGGRKQLKRIFSYLYCGSTISLQRKLKKFRLLLLQ